MNSSLMLRRFFCFNAGTVTAASASCKKKSLVFLGSPQVLQIKTHSLLHKTRAHTHSRTHIHKCISLFFFSSCEMKCAIFLFFFRYLQLFWMLFSMHLKHPILSLRYNCLAQNFQTWCHLWRILIMFLTGYLLKTKKVMFLCALFELMGFDFMWQL